MWRVALLAPALYGWGTLYPPSDLSHAVMRVATCLALAAGAAWPRNPLGHWGMIFCIVGIAWSAIAAPDPWRALWSTHNRQEGAWQAAHYVALTLVLMVVPREKLVRWVAVAALGAAAWGLAPLGWVNGRLAGSAGNPLYLAPLLIVGIWGAWRASRTGFGSVASASGLRLSDIKSGVASRREAEEHAGYRTIWGWRAAAAVLALAAVATGSKGVGVAMVAAFGVLALAKAPRVAQVGAIVLALGIWVAPIPASGLIRLELGRVALHGIWAEPLGWGAEGFPFVWDTFWRGATATGEVWHDRVHSLVLDRAIEWGLVGVAGWLAVVVAAWRRAELPERMAITAYFAYSLTMFEMLWGAVGAAALLGYTLHGRPRRVSRWVGWTGAAVALIVGAAQLAQSRAAATAADFPAMQAAIEMWSPVGGDVVELYLKAQQTPASLEWAAGRVETRSPHATQQAMLLAVWDRRYCADLRLAAPWRPDVRMLCGGGR